MSSLALNYIVGLLARREYSEFELRNKMSQKGFEQTEIDEAIKTAQARKWQSDVRFCESYVNARAQRGYGANRIRQELRHLKGIADEVVSAVFRECEVDWSAIALQTLRKKFPHFAEKLDLKNKQKIWRYMLSHGFYSEEFADFIGRGEVD